MVAIKMERGEMKIEYIEAETVADARRQISELPSGVFWAGDQVVITYPDGQQDTLVFRNQDQMDSGRIITKEMQ